MNARRLVVLGALAALGALAVPGSATPATPAVPEPTCTPAPIDCTLWHTASAVTADWPPAPPGVTELGCESETITTDTDGWLVSCSWWTQQGGTTSREVPVRRDATPPSVETKPSRGPDSHGWYNRALTVDFAGSDGISGLAGCSADRTYAGPDSGSVTINGSCTDVAGNTRSASFGLKFDATPPSVMAKPDRKPNTKGWYNQKVRVEFIGSDATSGVDSCAPTVTYVGPDAKQAAVSGTCRDLAANVSGAAQFELKYDAKAPSLKRLRSAKLRGGGILLRWTSHDASTFAVARRPGREGARSSTLYTGPEHGFVDRQVTAGVVYRYTVTAYDDAGNDTAKDLRVRSTVTTRPTAKKTVARLTQPANGARVGAPPVLDWTAVRGATYYNVQLFRDGKKILSVWPSSTSIRLDRSWRFGGATQRLEPGRYRWYVWPGFGKRTASRYGKLVGTRTFVVTGT